MPFFATEENHRWLRQPEPGDLRRQVGRVGRHPAPLESRPAPHPDRCSPRSQLALLRAKPIRSTLESGAFAGDASRSPGTEKVRMDENQQLLRITNDEIRRLAAQFGADEGHFICECGQRGCLEIIRLTLEEFDTFCACADRMPLVARSHR